jgi:hypothetical protein
MAKRVPTILAAVEALEADGEELVLFDISQGLQEVDRLERILKFTQRIRAVVALGAPAHAYLQKRGVTSLPYAATLMNAPKASPQVVDFVAPPSAWVAVLKDLGRPGALVVPYSGKRELSALEPLREALAEDGRELVTVPDGDDLEERLTKALPGVAAVLYRRDVNLLTKKTATAIMRAASDEKVPLLGFTRKLLAAGATLALEVTPGSAARAALARALGQPEPELQVTRHLNERRMKILGLTLDPE